MIQRTAARQYVILQRYIGYHDVRTGNVQSRVNHACLDTGHAAQADPTSCASTCVSQSIKWRYICPRHICYLLMLPGNIDNERVVQAFDPMEAE